MSDFNSVAVTSDSTTSATSGAPLNEPEQPTVQRRGLQHVPKARGNLRARLVQRILPKLLEHISWGTLEVELLDGTVLSGGTSTPVARVQVRRDDLWKRLGSRGALGLGEAFTAGDFETDDLALTIELLARNLESAWEHTPLRQWRTFQERRPRFKRRNRPSKAREQISYHYDLGNDFYQLMLDRTMTYSSGIYEPPTATLEEAQLRKYRRICDELHLSADDHVLEVGCGWGGFAEVAAGEYGARVTGVTLSHEQRDWAVERMRRAGLDDRVDIHLQDYRSLKGQWSRIVSIEMLEAVGADGYDTYFAKLDALLAPDGLAAVQVICFNDRQFRRERVTAGWVRRYIFPGGMLPTITVLAQAMTESSRLMIHDLTEIGPHYARTLHEWRAAFNANHDQVRQLGFDTAFIRAWNFYLAYSEAGFRARVIRDVQLVLTRPMNDGLDPRVLGLGAALDAGQLVPPTNT
ncbi:MAG: Cyclopropane-fatty-acyl-phospholipid synthase [Thermoleophilia bacterium]|nr:Cyclopropane-fatty-acyl-phospholipid synthase [Thermoleophilia bacterium]